MARKWIGSADVAINEVNGAVLVEGTVAGSTTPSSMSGGTKTVANSAAPEPLVAIASPCMYVWVGPRIDGDGAAQNTKPCFIGDAADQNIPILPDNAEGMILRIDDAHTLFVKVGVNGEGVAYRIFA